MNKKLKAVIASYARSFLSAGIAVYATGNQDWHAVLAAGLAAVVPVAIRAANPNDAAFGLIADASDIEINKLAKKSAKKVAK